MAWLSPQRWAPRTRMRTGSEEVGVTGIRKRPLAAAVGRDYALGPVGDHHGLRDPGERRRDVLAEEAEGDREGRAAVVGPGDGEPCLEALRLASCYRDDIDFRGDAVLGRHLEPELVVLDLERDFIAGKKVAGEITPVYFEY